MRNGKVILFILVGLCSAAMSYAQRGRTSVDINYSVGVPTGSLRSVVPSTSFRGFEGNILHGISDRVSVGLGIGFQDFYQKNDRQLYKLSDGSDISAVMTYSIQAMPVMALVRYHFNPGASIQPFAGVGMGGNFVSYNQLFGEFSDEQAKVKLVAKPEVGLFVPFSKGGESGFTIGASYNIMPLNMGDVKNMNHVGIEAGVRLPVGRG